MIIDDKLTKQVKEAKYLATENTWRYRSIIRYFYNQYEKIKYWIYKEEVYKVLRENKLFKGYTIEQCRQDLDTLVQWGNLSAIQDTSKVSTLEEFMNKQFRYRLSEYSVEIERMTLKLESMFEKGGSLEPSLLERIRKELLKFPNMDDSSMKELGIWWTDINADFKRLNQNYQDYIRAFYSIKAEEMMKTKEFLLFKDRFIQYLREFIKGLQQNVYVIEETLKSIDNELMNRVLNKVVDYEMSIPRLDINLTRGYIKDNVYGRWKSIKEWFLGSLGKESEAEKLFYMTNEVIRKITRYAAQIIESSHGTANRKEEYRKLCNMFLACDNMEDAHKLSALSFGIIRPKHLKGDIVRETESINSSVFDEEPYKVGVKPRVRTYREKTRSTPAQNNSEKKQKILNKVLEKRIQEKNILNKYIKDGKIIFKNLPSIEKYARTTLLSWLTKAFSSSNYTAKTKDGNLFRVVNPNTSERCVLLCEDGKLDMPAYEIEVILEDKK